jgi:hypothetical protein
MSEMADLIKNLSVEDIKKMLLLKEREDKISLKEKELKREKEELKELKKEEEKKLRRKRKSQLKEEEKREYFSNKEKPEINFKKNYLLHKLFNKNTLMDYLNGRDICKEKELIDFLYEHSFTKFKKDYYVYNEEWKKMNLNEIVDICISNIERLYMSVNLYDIMGMDRMIRNQQYIVDLSSNAYKRKFKEFLKDFI